MHKKAIALLSAALVLAGMLTACGRHSRYGEVIVDRHGMEHVIMTDKDGVTVCDKNGNLVEIMTGSDKKPLPAVTENGTAAAAQQGEYQTNSITFPAPIEKHGVVEDQYCSISVPDGWTKLDDKNIMLVHEATNAQITITPHAADTASAYIEKVQTDCATVGAQYETSDETIDGLAAHTLRYTVDGLQFRLYVVTVRADNITAILCTADEDKAEQADFDAVLQTLRFK